jgi:hypothetical protein
LANFGKLETLTLAGHALGRKLTGQQKRSDAPEQGSIIMLLALLLQCLRCQRNLRYRNVLLGLWGFVLFSQIWDLGAPFGLLPFTVGYGTTFLGSGFMGYLILLLGVCCVEGYTLSTIMDK